MSIVFFLKKGFNLNENVEPLSVATLPAPHHLEGQTPKLSGKQMAVETISVTSNIKWIETIE